MITNDLEEFSIRLFMTNGMTIPKETFDEAVYDAIVYHMLALPPRQVDKFFEYSYNAQTYHPTAELLELIEQRTRDEDTTQLHDT